MYVREIHIRSFRHIENAHLGPFPRPADHSDLVVLAGPNGGGKSSVLELLGYALSNSWSLGWTLRRSFPTNAFEAAIAVTPAELDLVHQYVASSRTANAEGLSYLDETGAYYRGYNYNEGEYQKNASLHNQVHNLVTSALRNHYNRALGFFLRSDRSYPTEGFQRDNLFSYAQLLTRDHIWSLAFNASDVQYRDMFNFLVQQRYHYFRRLGAHYHALSMGTQQPEADPPPDPLLPYDQLLQKLFPGYRFADANEEVPTNLFIALPSGQVIPFTDLSSGEKEVFFILSFFLRHDVSNAVIVVDEPELHLHPELARLLIRTMQTVKPGNQLWLATHNPEIIDEAGRDRVTYLAKDPSTRKSVVVPGTNEEEALQQFRDMFGYSGYIGVGASVVFLEGLDSSSDRKMFSSLLPDLGSKVKLVPCKTASNLPRVNAAVLSILESQLGWIVFYLIRDRDYLTPDLVRKYRTHSAGRLYVLDRYHIENYLLDDEVIAKVQTEIFARPTSSEVVRAKLETIARQISGEVLRDMVAFRLNLIYRPEDFSLGRAMQGRPLLDATGNVDASALADLGQILHTKVANANSSLLSATHEEALTSLLAECSEDVRIAVTGEEGAWRSLFPGRRLLQEYARSEGLGEYVVLQNTLIKELSLAPERISSELRNVVATIVRNETFSA